MYGALWKMVIEKWFNLAQITLIHVQIPKKITSRIENLKKKKNENSNY